MSWVVGSGERSQVVGVVVGKAWVALGKFLEKICLPCGRNLSSGDIAKCDPKFSGWKTTLQMPYKCRG